MKMGVPPTARKARTGLLTPPGMTCCACKNRFCEFKAPQNPEIGNARGRGHFTEQRFIVFVPKMDHREEVVPAGEWGRPLVGVCDLRKAGKRRPCDFGAFGGDGPEDHDIVGVADPLVTNDGAEFADDPPFPEPSGKRENLDLGQTGLFRNPLKRATDDRDVPLKYPGDLSLFRDQTD
jgi:hypothetical protein